jgi:hypothetical protein
LSKFCQVSSFIRKPIMRQTKDYVVASLCKRGLENPKADWRRGNSLGLISKSIIVKSRISIDFSEGLDPVCYILVVTEWQARSRCWYCRYSVSFLANDRTVEVFQSKIWLIRCAFFMGRYTAVMLVLGLGLESQVLDLASSSLSLDVTGLV